MDGTTGTGAAADMPRSIYLHALAGAMARPSRDPSAALQSFLTLNAAYFLGDWLPGSLHVRLVRRLAAALDGLADLAAPAGEPGASQLAQHARELAAAFGPSAWTERIAAVTEQLVPRTPEDWAAAVRPAVAAARDRDGGALPGAMVDALLLAHARRRLWELAHPPDGGAASNPVPDWSRRLARRAAASDDGRSIQAAEALLAEIAYAPAPLSG
jgi:hypothetical protein